MNMVIVLEIVAGILVLAAAVRFGVRDVRQRSDASEQRSGPEDTGEVQERGSEREAEQHLSEVADQRDGEEAAALSASSTAPEPPTGTR
jgi:hypothetical protein